MLAHILSGAVLGVDAYLVRVEVDVGGGLPIMTVVGLPENAVREGRERVTAALLNCGFKLQARRITVNLAPADVRKEGSAFDLPLALGILAASGKLQRASLDRVCVIGELGLDGTVQPVRGVLSIADHCRANGVRELICPHANAAEASVVEALHVVAVRSLRDAVAHVRGEHVLPRARVAETQSDAVDIHELDFADVKGQETAKRALEIAAAGGHNVLMVGPPGSGKSMLARRLPGILPPLQYDEAIEATKVYSVAGRLRAGEALLGARPFRAPHHTISDAGLVGGGTPPRPGEASLAHTGVLFLDELPEFRRNALESLRQPLEDHHIVVARAGVTLCYPARFMLVAAMNPCPCGFFGSGGTRCMCSPVQVSRYVQRVSGPLLDRIDIHIEVPSLDGATLEASRRGESSQRIRARVLAARARQTHRFCERRASFTNADMGAREVRQYCGIAAAAQRMLRDAVHRCGLSARAYHRILRVARTVADLDAAAHITTTHVAEAVNYRALDRQLISH